MLLNGLLHPEILAALAAAGHGSRVLIADGNYPVVTESPPFATKVFVNLKRGVVSAPSVLEVLIQTVPLELALVMEPSDGKSPAIYLEFAKLLPNGVTIQRKKRYEFYEEVKSPATALIIATGEHRPFGNILLTIGAVRSNEDESSRPAGL